MKPLLIILGGATGSGKTDLAIELAEHFKTAVISADSRQCYREMSIGTAKPDQEQLKRVPHYFIDSHSIHEPVNAGIFVEYARNLLAELFSKHSLVVMAGGTGLYLHALTEGIDELPSVRPEIRLTISDQYNTHGISYLQKIVSVADPEYFDKVDRKNPARLMRAAEIILQTDRPYSCFLKKAQHELPFDTLRLVPELDRKALYHRIDQRVDKMMETGFEAEARSLFPFADLKALQTVGYSEMFDHFRGQQDLRTTVSLIKQHTRNYAKRQLTWFRNKALYRFVPKDELVQFVIESRH
jgi:tRNA dimethylallyltransferase